MHSHSNLGENAFKKLLKNKYKSVDRLLGLLLFIQWMIAISVAWWSSSKLWNSDPSETKVHLTVAIFLGGLIASLPIGLSILFPTRALTRHVIAAAQMLMGALLIHLSRGRIETHFHIFGSLAFLAFYRDWSVLLTASLVSVADHYLRGKYWPLSIYGISYVDQWRWLEHSAWIIFEDIFLINSGILGRKELRQICTREAKLEMTNSTFEEAQQIAHFGSWEYDLKTEHFTWSKELYRIYGITGDGFNGTVESLSKYLPLEDQEKMKDQLQKCIKNPDPFRMEHRLVRPNGTIRTIDVRGRVHLDRQGRARKILGTSLDISEAKLAQDTIAEQQAKLLASSKFSALGEMAGNIAHEINTPLGAITLSNKALEKNLKQDMFDKTYALKLTERIDHTCHRISRTIDSLRSYARDGSKDPIQEVQIYGLIQETLDLCAEKLKASDIRLDYKNSLRLDRKLACRPTEIVQVLVNLLNNATDAVSSVSDKWIALEVTESGESCIIVITDSGPGIPIEVKEKIFQPFFTTKPAGIGSGIGLSVSKKIIESHNGIIEIDVLSKNTCFRLCIPNPIIEAEYK